MQDVGRGVEGAADAVAAEVAHHREPALLNELLDGVADVAKRVAGADQLEAAHEGFVGDVDDHLGAPGKRAHGVHAAAVAVPPVEDRGHVDVEDVARLQTAFAGNAVADDVVDRDAGGFGIAAIVQGRGDGAAGFGVVVDDAVELAGGDAGSNVRRDHVEGGGGQTARASHALEIVLGVDDDTPSVDLAVDVHSTLRRSVGRSDPAVVPDWCCQGD